MTDPWLSIVMPVRNGQLLLPAALRSVADEQPSGVELLILDSSDDIDSSRAIATAFGDRIDIRWLDARDLSSWVTKTNRGVAMARAPHIAMLHHDDLWRTGHLDALRGALASAPELAMSVGPAAFIDAQGRAIGHWRLPFPPGLYPPLSLLGTLIVQNTIATPAPMISRRHWLEVGGFDAALWYTADWDLYLKLARVGQIHVRAAETTAYRLHGSSLTISGSRNPESFRNQLATVLERHLPHVRGDDTGRIERRARSSLEINCLLASPDGLTGRRMARLAQALLGLGVRDGLAYLRQSRLADRLLPRLRLKRQGAL